MRKTKHETDEQLADSERGKLRFGDRFEPVLKKGYIKITQKRGEPELTIRFGTKADHRRFERLLTLYGGPLVVTLGPSQPFNANSLSFEWYFRYAD